MPRTCQLYQLVISIHAPREGSDAGRNYNAGPGLEFLSTLPVRGATHGKRIVNSVLDISIHAPREGSDVQRYRSM